MKTILVTGAGTGIGLAIAKVLAENGYSLILMGRTISRLEEAQSQMPSSEKHFIAGCDVRDRNALDNALQRPGLNLYMEWSSTPGWVERTIPEKMTDGRRS